MKHLIIGASGQVGSALYSCGMELGLEMLGTWLSTPRHRLRKLDITDRARVLRLIREISPDVIYVAAAMTNVDRCQGEPDRSFEVNVEGVSNLVDAANKVEAKLVLISTDYIFDGEDGPYDEDALPNPLSVYGWHKLIAEHVVATRCEDYLIARTTVVYGWEEVGKNFVVSLRQRLLQGQTVRVPDDQVGTPTYNRNLAQCLLELGSQGEYGVINLAGTSLVSRYEFALQVAVVFGLDSRLIRPVSTRSLEQKARRPLSAGLVTKKAQSLLKIPLLSSEEGLAQMLRDDL